MSAAAAAAGANSKKEPSLTPQEKVTAEWDRMAGEWDDLAGGYATGFEAILWDKIKDDDNTTNKNESHWAVLDFGCGTGLLAEKLRNKVASVVGVDVSAKMVAALQEKIKSRAWANVKVVSATLGNLANESDETRAYLESLYGSLDMVVASSVLTFVPQDDMAGTMEQLGKLLKPGGVLVHSDWPKSEAKHPDAMSTEKATFLYKAAGLSAVSTETLPLDAGGHTMDVFFGIARKVP
jgi:2-polyprenyl-3-methyl-5-hydroxy-6-metoxy-1,4-benzoquinol methylase